MFYATLSRVNVNANTGLIVAEFRQLRLYACGFWSRTIARSLSRDAGRSFTMTLHTTVNCSTNYVRQSDEGKLYFIAIKRSWSFNESNYSLRQGDAVIQRNRVRRSRELVSSLGLPTGWLKMTDQIAGHENARHEIAWHENTGHEVARHDKYLLIVVSTNPRNFSSIVENLK